MKKHTSSDKLDPLRPEGPKQIGSDSPEKVYTIQTGAPGSYTHQALAELLGYEILEDPKVRIEFGGSHKNTMELACSHSEDGNTGVVFVALENNLIGGIVPGVNEALEHFDIVEFIDTVSMRIVMCLLRSHPEIPLEKIASHPAALKQIENWKKGRNLEEISVPEGTSKAAEDLSAGVYDPAVGVIGSEMLAKLYNLVATEIGIEDRESYTKFGMLRVRRR